MSAILGIALVGAGLRLCEEAIVKGGSGRALRTGGNRTAHEGPMKTDTREWVDRTRRTDDITPVFVLFRGSARLQQNPSKPARRFLTPESRSPI